MPKFKIRHITKYTYQEPVRDSANQIILYPVRDAYQDVQKQTITITGSPNISLYVDHFGNEVGTFTNPFPHTEMVIDSKVEVVTHPREFQEDVIDKAEQWRQLEELRNDLEFIDFFKPEPFASSGEMQKVIDKERCLECKPFTVAQDFTDYIFHNFKYQKGITTVESTLEDIWKLKSGVCQDFAHILLYMLRLVNIPARYVSGYICPNESGMRGEGATHAWAEAYVPTQGWVGFDPTNNCVVNDAHVRLAVGKSFTDCSPVKGTYRGTAGHELEVTVTAEYEDGTSAQSKNNVIHPVGEPVRSFSHNSFRRFQEMQMQQQ